MGFFSNMGNAIVGAVNDTLGTNLSIGSSGSSGSAPNGQPPLAVIPSKSQIRTGLRQHLESVIAMPPASMDVINQSSTLIDSFSRSPFFDLFLNAIASYLRGNPNQLAFIVGQLPDTYIIVRQSLPLALNNLVVQFGGIAPFGGVGSTLTPTNTTQPSNSIGSVVSGILDNGIKNLTGGIKTAVNDAGNALIGGVGIAVQGTIQGVVNTGLDAVFDGNQAIPIKDKAGNILSQIMDSALAQWFKRHWFWVLLPVSLLATAYFYRRNGRKSKTTRKRR